MLDSLLLAHQGGWDEILMVLVPVGVFAALLYFANQRAAKLGDRVDSEDSTPKESAPKNPRGGPR
ncbi:unannotated protein [freshwater metagenome]|uniref:Unannotated protein n=1 Tax=freshwater metagenome TaxID=449393 RepID=A0A6J6D049_9ZZZZ|nr:hypothetical protein [Actinomycetota bacterium]MSY79903.1 hypothetical protein [Actinomycetota bacterium]